MLITVKNEQIYIYKKTTYRYGELSLNFINYKRNNANTPNLFIDFKDDFSQKYQGDKFNNLQLFTNIYNDLTGRYKSDKEHSLIGKKDYILSNKKIWKLIQTPYYIYINHDFVHNTTQLEFKRFQDFLIFDLYNFCLNDTFILSCPNCNNLFVTKTWGEKVYCSKTCRMKYTNKITKEKINNNPILEEYYLCRKRYYSRIERNPSKYCADIFYSWNDKALTLKNECKSDKNKYYEFERFLKIDPFK